MSCRNLLVVSMPLVLWFCKNDNGILPNGNMMEIVIVAVVEPKYMEDSDTLFLTNIFLVIYPQC